MRYVEIRMEEGRYLIIYAFYGNQNDNVVRHIASFHSYSTIPQNQIDEWIKNGTLL